MRSKVRMGYSLVTICNILSTPCNNKIIIIIAINSFNTSLLRHVVIKYTQEFLFFSANLDPPLERLKSILKIINWYHYDNLKKNLVALKTLRSKVRMRYYQLYFFAHFVLTKSYLFININSFNITVATLCL